MMSVRKRSLPFQWLRHALLLTGALLMVAPSVFMVPTLSLIPFPEPTNLGAHSMASFSL